MPKAITALVTACLLLSGAGMASAQAGEASPRSCPQWPGELVKSPEAALTIARTVYGHWYTSRSVMREKGTVRVKDVGDHWDAYQDYCGDHKPKHLGKNEVWLCDGGGLQFEIAKCDGQITHWHGVR